MLPSEDLIQNYISYFTKEIIGFKVQESKYMAVPDTQNEFLLIVMDKVARLTKKHGKLRNRVWNNCYFIFHQNSTPPEVLYKKKVLEIKKNLPHLFVRSYIYFIFVDYSRINQSTLFGEKYEIEISDFKIWLFNSKYELKRTTAQYNIFNLTLKENEELVENEELAENEEVDDFMYIANPKSEFERMRSANSDAIDCVKSFTGDLVLLEQTVSMLDKVTQELETNKNARILLEGPARSGKTIIAASLLGKYGDDAKFLLMNYFFYKALVDGFHALSNWSKDEINQLFRNPQLEFFIEMKQNFSKHLRRILGNLKYAIIEHEKPKKNSKTKDWLLENIKLIIDFFDSENIDYSEFELLHLLRNLYEQLIWNTDEAPFKEIDLDMLVKTESVIKEVLDKKLNEMKVYEELISQMIEEVKKNSKQKFFHHNIRKSISKDVSEGCWIIRGNPTESRMWSSSYSPKLIICDEVQRLGLISNFQNYDEFDETKEILKHSQQTFFTGDNFQRLNYKYDKGIERINEILNSNNQKLQEYELPETVGVPAEIGILMKYLTNPDLVDVNDVIDNWKEERHYNIVVINKNQDLLVEIFDRDTSNKKHFAAPMDTLWTSFDEAISIESKRREAPIISLKNHEKEDFAYKYPYFCNEEIMPNFILSAYELISREVESLYVHIPEFEKDTNNTWYKNHLYVLYTRPTSRLVINFENEKEYQIFKELAESLKMDETHMPISFV